MRWASPQAKQSKAELFGVTICLSDSEASRVTSEDSSLRARSAKITASVIGISALLLVAIGPALYWQEVQVQYHLYRLRNEPGYLKEAISAPEKSIQRSAMIEYLGTAGGKERSFELEINEHSKSRLAGLERHRVGRNGVLWDPTRPVRGGFP